MNNLEFYELLEKQALKFDDSDNNFSEKIRYLMDFIWNKHLTKEDKKFINSRNMV